MENIWENLVERSWIKYQVHDKSKLFWYLIYNIMSIMMIIISSIITAEGIGEIFSRRVLTGFGITATVLSSIMAFLNPGSRYEQQRSASKKYRNIFHQTKRCEKLEVFMDLQKTIEEIDQESPDAVLFFNDKSKGKMVINPLLSKEMKKYYGDIEEGIIENVEEDSN